MALGIHEDLKNRLKLVFANHFKDLRINNNTRIDTPSLLNILGIEKSIPKHGDIYEKLSKYVGDVPLVKFIDGYLSREIFEENRFKLTREPVPISDLEKYSDSFSVADRLIEAFDSLPWQYKYTIQFSPVLNPIINQHNGEYILSDSLKIIKPDSQFMEDYSLVSGIKNRDDFLFGNTILTGPIKGKWDQDCSYLQFSVDGFFGHSRPYKPSEHTLDLFKAFCGLSIGVRLINIKTTYQTYFSQKIRSIIHKNESDKWVISNTELLPSDISRIIPDIIFDDFNGEIVEEKTKVNRMTDCLGRIKKVLSNPGETENIILAAQWFFDSYIGDNELLSFVQSMVCLEILLGDKASSDIIGLGELLRNRCAYLVGKNNTQRNKIMADFKKIYDIRSKIVHRGKSKLTSGERALFRKLQWLCRRVIQEEINLIDEDTSV